MIQGGQRGHLCATKVQESQMLQGGEFPVSIICESARKYFSVRDQQYNCVQETGWRTPPKQWVPWKGVQVQASEMQAVEEYLSKASIS